MNIAEMKAKLTRLNSKGAHPDSYQPEEGENTIRILPYAKTPDNPFVELYFHYFTGKTIISPLSWGNVDPIQEFSDGLISKGKLTKEEYKDAKQFSAQLRTYALVIDRNKEKDGPKWWGF